MTTTTTTHIERASAVLILWADAYEAWAKGEAHSPSADDLLALAHRADPDRSCWQALDADRLFEMLCTGMPIAEILCDVIGLRHSEWATLDDMAVALGVG